jgi:hypothetical protein
MEIRDHVSGMRWRLSLLVLLPLIAGGLAFALLADTPKQYEAESVLTVPASVAGGSSSGSMEQYMANFEQAIVTAPVVTAVSNEVGADAEAVRSGLDTARLGSSSLIRVSYRGTDPDEATRVVALVTQSAFDLVAQIQLPFGQSLEVLRSRVRTAETDLQAAETGLQEFLLETGVVLPREQYLIVASDIARLESEILQAESDGSGTDALVAALQERRRELEELGAMLPEYERLRAGVDRAEEDLDGAEDELRLAENQVAHLKPQFTEVDTSAVPRLQTIGRGVAIAAGGAFIVAIVLMLLIPSRRPSRSRTPQPLYGTPPRP